MAPAPTLRLGIAHHLGWAVAVTAGADHRVVDRRRIELIDGDLPAAPIHHEGGPHAMHRRDDPLDDAELTDLVARVRAAATRLTAAGLDRLAADLDGHIVSISLRAWPVDLPTDVALLRRAPHESQADSVMYREVLAEAASARGWEVHRFDATAEADAAAILGGRADAVLRGPRAALGPPWAKDHRMALAATVLAAG